MTSSQVLQRALNSTDLERSDIPNQGQAEWTVRATEIYRTQANDLEDVAKPFRVNNRKRGEKRGKYTKVSVEVKNKLIRLV